MDPNFISTTAVLCVLTIMIWQLEKIREDCRLVRTLLAAFMEQRVAGTVAENRLAAAVHEASKDTAVTKR